MKNHRILLALLVTAMLMSLAACTTAAPTAAPTQAPAASTEPTVVETPTPSQELYTVTAFSEVANYAGEQPGWYAKLIKDKFNMVINIEAPQVAGGGEAVFATKLVSGDLGEIIVFGDSSEHVQQAIDNNLLLDWGKDDLITKNCPNIMQYYTQAIQYNKSQFGGGTAIYGIGHETSNSNEGPGELLEFVWGPYLRWDVYAKVGYPEITDMEGYLPVLKQMQEMNPKSKDDKPVYAFSFWKDWDGSHMMNAKQFACMYGYNDDTGGVVLVHYSEPKYQDLLQEDGYYLRTLKLYFDANQQGLVDPESPTQNWDIMYAKALNGQTLFSWFSWLRPYNTEENQNEGVGLMMVPFKDEVICSYGMNVFGGNRMTSIGVGAKYPERIMQLYDWECSPAGAMEKINGPEGMAWSYQDGKPVLTEFGKTIRLSDQTVIPDEFGGGVYRDGSNKWGVSIVNVNSVSPETNEPYTWDGWSSTLALAPTKLDANWREKMGAVSGVDWFKKNGKFAIYKPTATKVNTTLPEDLQGKLDQVSAIIRENSWKMIFAKDAAEFDSLKAEMITKTKDLGYDEIKAANIAMAEQMFALR